MKKRTKDQEFDLEEYDGKPIEYDEDITDEEEEEPEDVDYSEYNQPNQFDVDEDYEDEDEESIELAFKKNKKQKSNLSRETEELLRTIFKWYGFVGVIIALFLIATYISKGNIGGLVLYIILLVASYIGGYFLMYVIDKPRN